MLPDKVAAHCFWIDPERPEVNTEIERALKNFARRKNTMRNIDTASGEFHVCEPCWRTANGFESFTGTVFKVRKTGLPSALGRDGPVPLPIDEHTDIGECMCFSYSPAFSLAMVHYAHHGPRHPVLSDVLHELDIDGPIAVLPVVRRDIMDRFTRSTVVGKLEYGFKLPVDPEELRKSGGALSHLIDAATACGGATMHVTISIEAGMRSKVAKAIKRNVQAFLDFGHKEVTTLKIDAAQSEEKVCESLDLLRARFSVTIDVTKEGRYFGRDDCQKSLHSSLREAIDEIRSCYPERFRRGSANGAR